MNGARAGGMIKAGLIIKGGSLKMSVAGAGKEPFFHSAIIPAAAGLSCSRRDFRKAMEHAAVVMSDTLKGRYALISLLVPDTETHFRAKNIQNGEAKGVLEYMKLLLSAKGTERIKCAAGRGAGGSKIAYAFSAYEDYIRDCEDIFYEKGLALFRAVPEAVVVYDYVSGKTETGNSAIFSADYDSWSFLKVSEYGHPQLFLSGKTGTYAQNREETGRIFAGIERALRAGIFGGKITEPVKIIFTGREESLINIEKEASARFGCAFEKIIFPAGPADGLLSLHAAVME